MNINFLFSIFTPKDKKFLPLFKETAGIMELMASQLEALFKSSAPDHIVKWSKAIKEEEVKGDKVTERIHKALFETFITPFDREDIDSLADDMDDCLDAMNRVAQKVLLYCPKSHAPASVEMVAIIGLGVAQVVIAVAGLKSLKKSSQELRNSYKKIKELEELGDVVYEKAIMAIFREETDTIELIKQKEITQELERTVNRINTIGKTLKTIFIKYA